MVREFVDQFRSSFSGLTLRFSRGALVPEIFHKMILAPSAASAC